MKQQYKRILFVAFFLLSFLMINSSSVDAHAHPVNEKRDVIVLKEKAKEEDKSEEEEIPNGASGCSGYSGDLKEQCEKDREATTSTAPFMAKAILSLDNAIAEKELDKDYIKNFENSSATALAYEISLFNPPTIVMWIINVITSIFEKLGLLISLIVMILYNVASSSFIQTVIRGVFETLEAVVFDWSDVNSYIYKVLFLFGLVALSYRLFENRKQHFSISRLLNMVVMTVASCAVIVFIGMYGKPLMIDIETKMETSLTETFSLEKDKQTPLEIQTKEMLFENLQMKSFRLRHFGVTDEDQITELEQIKETNKERVDNILNNPTTSSAFAERFFGNENISYSIGSCMKILGLSLIFIVHRVFLSLIFGAGALVLVLLVLIKEILLGVSVFAVIFTLLKRNKSSFSWFLSRIQWAILCVLAKSFYAIFLYLISYLIDEAIANGGIILMIVLDIGLFFAGKLAIKKLPGIIENFLSDCNMEGQGAFQIAKGFLIGDFTPKDIYDNHKKRKAEMDEETEVMEEEEKGINSTGMSADESLMDVQEDMESDESEVNDNELAEKDEVDSASADKEETIEVEENTTVSDNEDIVKVNENSVVTDNESVEEDLEEGEEQEELLQNSDEVSEEVSEVVENEDTDPTIENDTDVDDEEEKVHLYNDEELADEVEEEIQMEEANYDTEANANHNDHYEESEEINSIEDDSIQEQSINSTEKTKEPTYEENTEDLNTSPENPEAEFRDKQKRMSDIPAEEKDDFFDEIEWEDLDI